MQINEDQLKKVILDSGLIPRSELDEEIKKAETKKQKLSNILLSDGKISETDLRRMEAFVKQLKKEGYDGIISCYYLKNIKGEEKLHQEFVAFEPNQIKSVYNNGNFDDNSKNILEDVAIIWIALTKQLHLI